MGKPVPVIGYKRYSSAMFAPAASRRVTYQFGGGGSACDCLDTVVGHTRMAEAEAEEATIGAYDTVGSA